MKPGVIVADSDHLPPGQGAMEPEPLARLFGPVSQPDNDPYEYLPHALRLFEFDRICTICLTKRTNQYRPCTIDVTPLEEISKWTEQYRHIWEARFDRMDDYINQLNNEDKSNG